MGVAVASDVDKVWLLIIFEDLDLLELPISILKVKGCISPKIVGSQLKPLWMASW